MMYSFRRNKAQDFALAYVSSLTVTDVFVIVEWTLSDS